MKPAQAETLDLNLLVTLDAVLAAGNLKAAATRLGVTPSAVSHSLRRLREALGDPLVVRTPRGLVPTATAEQLAAAVRSSLDQLSEALEEARGFDPRTARRKFRLFAADYTGTLLLPPLMRHLEAEAPGIDVVVRPHRPELFDELEKGLADLALGIFPEAPATFRRQALFEDRNVCVMRAGHPAGAEPLTLERYLQYRHVSIAPKGTDGSLTETALAAMGRRRRVALVVPHFLVAPMVVAETDYLLMLPERLAKRIMGRYRLQIVAAPVEVPSHTMYQIWHERANASPAHMWLRRTLAEVAARHDP